METTIQPKSSAGYDKKALERIKRTAENLLVSSRGMAKAPEFATNLPSEIGLQLTNRCNLRCRHCFQWNDSGYIKGSDASFQNEELGIEVLQKVFEQTREVKSSLYLWGGEPTFYRHWDTLTEMLAQDPRKTVLCTNGILLKEKLDSLTAISEDLTVLASVEGFEYENDAIRGTGTFHKVIQNIDLLLDLQKKGIYKGKISVECVVNASMVDKLYAFVEYFEQKGIDTLFICFPWYISSDTAKRMDGYCQENLGGLYHIPPGTGSWHSYTYSLDRGLLETLGGQMAEINQHTWKIRVRYQPPMDIHEIENFISGGGVPVQNRSKCLSITYRMDVLASGKVSPCKLFPELALGDLNHESIQDIWHSSRFAEFRRTLNKGLTPVCSKCVLLYLHGR